MGGVRIVITESVGLRIAKEHVEESKRRGLNNICYLDQNNLEVNQQDTDLHTIAEEASPAGPVIVLSQDKRELIDSSDAILARANTHQGYLDDQDFDTRIKERPSKNDLNNIKNNNGDNEATPSIPNGEPIQIFVDCKLCSLLCCLSLVIR